MLPEELIPCPHCGGSHAGWARFCPVKGGILQPVQQRCAECQALFPLATDTCPNCGAYIEPVPFPKIEAPPPDEPEPAPEPAKQSEIQPKPEMAPSVLIEPAQPAKAPDVETLPLPAEPSPSPASSEHREMPGNDVRQEPKSFSPAITLTRWAAPTAVLVGILLLVAAAASFSRQPANVEPTAVVVAPPQNRPQGIPAEALVREPTLTHPITPTRSPLPSATFTQIPTASPTPTVLPYILDANLHDGADVVFVPAGDFLMGSAKKGDPDFYGSEGPPHKVNLDAFWIYRTEVTNAMYQACVEAKACPLPAGFNSSTRSDYYQNPRFSDYPVVNVDWRSAAAYCDWAGGRLPTEAEWEKAGRGEDGRLFPWGNLPPSPELVNYLSGDTTAVGSFPLGASPYGALDMAGNVIEWVFDYFQATYYSISPLENPRGPAAGSRRVYRSGSFHNDAGAIRVVMRGSRPETTAQEDIGFRCALDEVARIEASGLPEATSTLLPAISEPQGKIVYVCQLNRNPNNDQICIMNADGSGQRRLTQVDGYIHNYPSLSPDGRSVVFVSNRSGAMEIYEWELSSGVETQLTFGGVDLAAPEISPDGSQIVFTYKGRPGNSVWIMNRDGSHAHQVYGPPQGFGWDPVWSPDGIEILFAGGTVERAYLYRMRANGSNVRRVSDLVGLRGRCDWSPLDDQIATYAGPDWDRDIYVMDLDGKNLLQLTNGGANNAPSYSPDGQWLVFLSYRDFIKSRNPDGCEIYIMRSDGSDVRRLTNNDYCDWQPRWGP